MNTVHDNPNPNPYPLTLTLNQASWNPRTGRITAGLPKDGKELDKNWDLRQLSHYTSDVSFLEGEGGGRRKGLGGEMGGVDWKRYKEEKKEKKRKASQAWLFED